MPPVMFIWFLELELCRLTPRKVGRIAEIVDQVMGKFELTFLEKSFPSDPLRPLTEAFVFVGVFGISLDDLLNALCGLRPARRLVGNKGHHDFGELRRTDAVGYFSTRHDDDTVTFGVRQRHGGAHGVAVAAEHTALFLHGHAVDLLSLKLNLSRLNRRRRAGRNRQRNLAHLVEIFVIQQWRLAMVSQNGDIRAVNRTAHVQTTGQ